MGTGAVQSATSSPTTGSTTTASSNAPGQLNASDFMTLLLDQMKNQDPLQPMDDSQLMGQLAQLTMVDKMQEMSQNLATMLNIQQLGQAANLVGKTVQGVDSSGDTVKGVVDSATMADNAASVVVGGKTIPLTGINTVVDEAGARLLKATSLIGKEVQVSTGTSGSTTKGVVSSVELVDGSPTLVMSDGSTASLGDLVSVDDLGSTQLTRASSLLGKQVVAITASGSRVSGIADEVETGNGGLQLNVGGTPVNLEDIISVAKDPNNP